MVIISDAMRYEVGQELFARMQDDPKCSAQLNVQLGVLPSYTRLGMAALLPHRTLEMTDDFQVLVDGTLCDTLAGRQQVLQSYVPDSVCIQFDVIKSMKVADLRDVLTKRQVIYVYHNQIDARGDKPNTEDEVFAACREAVEEIAAMIRRIAGSANTLHFIVTADHGFLYTYKPLGESDKINRKAFSGNVYELGRRYALTAPDTTADFLLPVNLERELDGTPIKGYAPQDTIRMKVQGGGEKYVHGGISLQELVVPVIAFKNLRTSNKNYVEVKNAELKLLSESRKISNLIFSLEFHQRQPVGDKIQPCTYSIYMTDDEGVVISDRQTVIADKTSDNAADRVFRVRFNLKAGTYDKKKVYRLVIANEIDVEEIEFHIDIAFADDFGFDL